MSHIYWKRRISSEAYFGSAIDVVKKKPPSSFCWYLDSMNCFYLFNKWQIMGTTLFEAHLWEWSREGFVWIDVWIVILICFVQFVDHKNIVVILNYEWIPVINGNVCLLIALRIRTKCLKRFVVLKVYEL